MSWQAIVDAAEAIRAEAVASERSLTEVPLAGIGWATVDAERAKRELDELLALDDEADEASAHGWVEQPRDGGLGARVWLRSAPDVADRPWLVVLEPDTEGRLAASLARHGEGVAAVYVGAGPYRAGVVRAGGPAWGPHVMGLGPDGGARG